MDVFDFAMKMELDGKAYYRKFAQETSHAGLRTIFTMLAADEEKHYNALQAMKSGAFVKIGDSRALEHARNVFDELIAAKGTPPPIKSDLDGYRHALKIEAESVRLYEDMAAKETREDIRGLLVKIAEEEKKHYNVVENIIDFVAAPQTYLAWGEFSNLKEF